MSCSNDGTCPCACNYAVDAGCICRDLDGTVTVTVNKPPVSVRYKMGPWMTTVHQLPVEEPVYVDTCVDAAASATPTCGWWDHDWRGVQADSQVPVALTYATLSF